MGNRLGLFKMFEKDWRGMEIGYGIEWVEREVSKNLKMWFGYRWKGMVRSRRIRREFLHLNY